MNSQQPEYQEDVVIIVEINYTNSEKAMSQTYIAVVLRVKQNSTDSSRIDYIEVYLKLSNSKLWNVTVKSWAIICH